MMQPKHANACPAWADRIAECAGETDGGGQWSAVAAHVKTCAGCAQAAEELSALRRALRALPARQTSPAFESCLAARLAGLDAQRERASWRTQWADWWHGHRAVRPALALGAMTLALAGAAFFGHVAPVTVHTLPAVSAPDLGLVSHCVEQHRTEAAAQPLSDLSAQNLAAQVDGGASADASAGAANEDGL